MNLLVVGVDHVSAPTSIRERLAFDGAVLQRGLDGLVAAFPGVEFVLLSTCNRVEIYAAANPSAAELPGVDQLIEWVAHFHELDAQELRRHMTAHRDERMIDHLFRVAASLESLVIGEGQILGQVREAYRQAAERQCVGPLLHDIFQQAIRVGKRVREETGMDRGRLSVASVAVEVARDVFDEFRDKSVLVIGAGKMADLTLQHIMGLNPGRVTLTTRSIERAERAAARFNAATVPFERLGQALIDSDLIISTTASPELIVTREMFTRVQRARRHRLILILDLAVPRDFDARIAELQQVLLFNVDDLQRQVDRNREARSRQIQPALALIAAETHACGETLLNRDRASELLRQLGANADQVRCRELEKLYSRCPEFTGDQREVIEQFAQRLQNQLLHHPRAALRGSGMRGGTADEAVEAPPHSRIVEVFRHIFGLGRDAACKPTTPAGR